MNIYLTITEEQKERFLKALKHESTTGSRGRVISELYDVLEQASPISVITDYFSKESFDKRGTSIGWGEGNEASNRQPDSE